MGEIIFSGVSDEFLSALRQNNTIHQLKEEEWSNINLKEVDLIIFDEHIKNPIRLLQNLNSIDKLISVVIFRNPLELESFKVALQFTPFIGNNIKIYSATNKENFKSVAKELIEQTHQRRNYNKLISATGNLNLIDRAPDLHIAYLDKFLDEAPVGAILLDEQNDIVALNKYAQDLIQIYEEQAYKSTIFQFFMSDELDKISDFLSEHNKVINSRIANGKFVKISISKISGNNNYRILIIHDISERIKIEKELQQKMVDLERSNKELEQFAYIVSHDLKNPISSMMLTAELADDETDMNEIKDHITRIKKSSDQLMDIVKGLEEIIDVQKNLEAHIQKISFNEIFYNVVYDYERQLKEINANVKTDFSEVPSINYIQPYLTSIFSNLISNAIKYRKEDTTLELTVSTRHEGEFILLSIRDNGIGMNLNHHGQDLFKPFRRFTEQATGKGIGLSIIKQMISRNRGFVEVKSAEGAGTEFLCHLRPYA